MSKIKSSEIVNYLSGIYLSCQNGKFLTARSLNNTVQLTSLVSNTASLRFTDATSGGGRNMPRRPDNSRPPSVRSYDPESLAPQSQRLDLSDEPAGRRTGLEFSSAGCALWGGSIAQQPHCAGLWLPVSRELLNTLQDADNRFSYLLKLMDETQSKVVSVISVWSFLNFVECNDLKLLEILGNDNGFYIKHRAKLDNFDFGEMNDLYKILELRHDERAEQEEDCGITLNDMRLISRLKLFQECLRYRAGQKSLIIKTAQKMGLVTTHAALLRVAESDLELKLLLLNMYFHKVYVIQALSFYNWLEKHIKSSKISAIDFKNLRPSCPKGRCQLKLVSISNLFLKCFFDSESFQFTKDPVTGRIRRNKKVIYCDECQSRATNSEFKWKFNFRKQEIQPVPETVFYFHCGTHHYDICTKCAKEKTNPSAGCHNQNRRY